MAGAHPEWVWARPGTPNRGSTLAGGRTPEKADRMPVLLNWSPARVRTRLLAAFLLLLMAAIALAITGWIGMRGTQQALAGFEQDVLPGISNALELAERTAQLAAVAPFVAESATRENLNANANTVESLVGEIQRLSTGLHPSVELQPVMTRMLAGVGNDLTTLVALTRQRQSLQERLQRQLTRIDEAGGALRNPARNEKVDPAIHALWSSLVLGATTETQAKLGELEANVEAFLLAIRRRGGSRVPEAPFAATLVEIATGPDDPLTLKRNLIDVDKHIAYLVGLTRTNADDLSREVARHVAELRATASHRNDLVQRAVRSGETGMLVLALLALAIAVLATRYVRRLVGEVETITSVMSRLAQGDTAQPTPAIKRRDELGALARTFEVFRDTLLARQQLVTDLKTQSELLDAVHNSMTDALAVFDRQGRLLLWNPQLAKFLSTHATPPRLGVNRRELLGSFPPDSVWTVPGQPDPGGLHPVHEVDFSAFAHIELHLHGGAVFDLRSRAMPDGGRVTLITDLTTRRAVENQIQHTQRLELLGQLTGGVAHDFNNLLGTILGNLSMLQDQPSLDAAGRQQLQRALRATGGAAGLTRRLLAFARRQPLQAEWVPVDEMVEEMRDLVEYSAGPRVDLVLQLAAGAAQVCVDRGQLENALLNLVINSTAAMPSGGRLTIATRHGVQDGAERVDIEVSDTGTGIAEHLLGRVFEPFFTTKPVTEGSGLGLSIVYGFVNQSGGAIDIRSEVGVGTHVTMRFPVAQAQLPVAPAAVPASPSPQRSGRLRVLLVDDDDEFRATVADMLRANEVTVVAARSGEEALALLEGGADFSAMLSDFSLGSGMNGLRLAQTVRTRWPHVRMALMSGLSLENFVEDADWHPDVHFMQKPFARDSLPAWLYPVADPAGS